MRQQDIEELITEAEGIVETLKGQKEQAKEDFDIKTIFKPKVKSVLEHLRSILDYSAQDISTKLTAIKQLKDASYKSPARVYFPYGANLREFNNSLSRSLPGLRIHIPNVTTLIESNQPYVSGSDWIVDLCKITQT